VRHLRQKFLPLCEFHYCNILRGTLGSQLPALTVDDPAYVVMWKKNDQTKQLSIVSVASLRVNDQFDITKWSYVLFRSPITRTQQIWTLLIHTQLTQHQILGRPRGLRHQHQWMLHHLKIQSYHSLQMTIQCHTPTTPEPPTIHMDPVVPHSPPLVPEVPAKRVKTHQEKADSKTTSTTHGPSTSSSSNQPMPTSGPIIPVDPTLPVNIPILPVDGDSDLESEASTLPYDTDAADLVIDEHPTVWAVLEDTHKVCSNTASFTVPQLFDDVVDVTEVMSFPHKMVFATNSTPSTTTSAALTAKSKVNRTSKEASTTDLRRYAKQFREAKKAENDSWLKNDIFDLIDTRMQFARNLVSGRWVLTIKRTADGSSRKCEARWGLRGFRDKQKWDPVTGPTCTRPCFRLTC